MSEGVHESPAPRDALLIAALVAGQTQAAAARTAGVCEKTVRRRITDPDFRRQLDEARQATFDAAAVFFDPYRLRRVLDHGTSVRGG